VASAEVPYGELINRKNPWTVPALLPDRLSAHRPGHGGAVWAAPVATGLAGTYPVDNVVPSDHYAVWADLRY
jgi:hypothetical protein